jgi:NAD(P)-dependent dehydrogenase (short-subunit alcohol dehydrogenase family)
MTRRTENKLLGKVAIVTGGAQGIGSECAKLLAYKGAHVIIADVNLSKAEALAQKIVNEGFSTSALYVDLGDEKSIEEMVKSAITVNKHIDILVNNAGILNAVQFPDITGDIWRRVIDINLTGTFLCTKAVLKVMVKKRSGSIVNISSIAGENGGPIVGPDYAASKAGLISLTKSIARYGAKYGIRANSVCPGYILTDMTRERHDDPASVPLGRLGLAEDVAKVVYFFASDLSDYVTGTTLEVDGGLMMR